MNALYICIDLLTMYTLLTNLFDYLLMHNSYHKQIEGLLHLDMNLQKLALTLLNNEFAHALRPKFIHCQELGHFADLAFDWLFTLV